MKRIVEEVAEIDRELRRYPWLDMEIADYTGTDLVVSGSLSETYPFEVRLIFREVQCVLARQSWHTNTEHVVFREIVDAEFNRQYGLEVGQRTFELVAEDVPACMRFSAMSVALEIHREPSVQHP